MADDGVTNPDTEVDIALAAVFPNGLPAGARPASASPIVRTFPLDETHLAKLAAHNESGAALGVTNAPLARIKRRHHRLAMILAGGEMDEGRAALMCGLHPSTVSILKNDPAFAELLAMYSDGVTAQFRDTVAEMAELAEDVIELIRQKLDAQGESVSLDTLMKFLPTLTDRTGNGPTSNHNVRAVSVALSGDDLQRLKAGADATRPVDRPLQRLAPEHREVINGVFRRAADPDASREAGDAAGTGEGVRAQDATLPSGPLFIDDAEDGVAS